MKRSRATLTDAAGSCYDCHPNANLGAAFEVWNSIEPALFSFSLQTNLYSLQINSRIVGRATVKTPVLVTVLCVFALIGHHAFRYRLRVSLVVQSRDCNTQVDLSSGPPFLSRLECEHYCSSCLCYRRQEERLPFLWCQGARAAVFCFSHPPPTTITKNMISRR